MKDMEGTFVLAPMPCKIVDVHVQEGQNVEVNQKLVTIEAMKVEMPVAAPADGTIRAVKVQPGQLVDTDAVLVIVG